MNALILTFKLTAQSLHTSISLERPGKTSNSLSATKTVVGKGQRYAGYCVPICGTHVVISLALFRQRGHTDKAFSKAGKVNNVVGEESDDDGDDDDDDNDDDSASSSSTAATGVVTSGPSRNVSLIIGIV